MQTHLKADGDYKTLLFCLTGLVNLSRVPLCEHWSKLTSNGAFAIKPNGNPVLQALIGSNQSS